MAARFTSIPKQHLIDMYGIIVSVSKPNHFRLDTRYTLIRRLCIVNGTRISRPIERWHRYLTAINVCVSRNLMY